MSKTVSPPQAARDAAQSDKASDAVDYSSRSFREARAAIDAAALKSAAKSACIADDDDDDEDYGIERDKFSAPQASTVSPTTTRRELRFGDATEGGVVEHASSSTPSGRAGRRVRHIGDTTIVTEHRDPYSFYWQLDEARRRAAEPPRRRFTPERIIDEVSVEDEEEEEEEVEEDQPPNVEEMVLSPDSHDSGVNMESYYAKPYKERLPAGWERHKDPSGYSYYWHVDSGTIQREPPPPPITPRPPPKHSPRPADDVPQTTALATPPPQPPLIIEEHAYRQTTTKRCVENGSRNNETNATSEHQQPPQAKLRFAVRSLGWTELADDELASAERSSRAVNAAILKLSAADVSAAHFDEERAPIAPADSAGAKYERAKELYLELDAEKLTLRDAETLNVVAEERIQQIRVWGVGKESPRAFAYVSRDARTRRFFCHVFRCESAPALEIANALREICRRIMEQRDATGREDGAARHRAPPNRRPSSLNFGAAASPNTPERAQSGTDGVVRRITRESLLLTPIDEPKRLIRCFFIGITQVPRATGIDVLNEAVDRLLREVGADRWLLADVSVAPSAIVIHEATPTAPFGATGGTLTRRAPPVAECRVRFLSFLGIGRDARHCAFIMHNTSAETFLCYVFRVEPNAALMAHTIEAACKLRYQKVLDAHIRQPYATGTPTAPVTATTTTFSHQ